MTMFDRPEGPRLRKADTKKTPADATAAKPRGRAPAIRPVMHDGDANTGAVKAMNDRADTAERVAGLSMAPADIDDTGDQIVAPAAAEHPHTTASRALVDALHALTRAKADATGVATAGADLKPAQGNLKMWQRDVAPRAVIEAQYDNAEAAHGHEQSPNHPLLSLPGVTQRNAAQERLQQAKRTPTGFRG